MTTAYLLDENALEALARAYDREEAACMGEPSPWDIEAPDDGGEWRSERLTCAMEGITAFADAAEPDEWQWRAAVHTTNPEPAWGPWNMGRAPRDPGYHYQERALYALKYGD